MDHRQRIIQMETQLTSEPRKLPFVVVSDTSFVQDKPLVEDHRLNNWKRWLRRRQRQYQALDEERSKGETEIMMNSCEIIRPRMEMRNSIESAMIYASSVPDEHRGDLGFWKVPPFLSCRGNLCLSGVGLVLTENELNLLPSLEHVGVSMCIREEQDLSNSLQKAPAWKLSSNPKKKKTESANYIAILQPATPKLKNQIARGQRCRHGKEYANHVPVISIMDTSRGNGDFEDTIQDWPVSMDIVVALRINNPEITRDDQCIRESSEITSEEITWTLHFSSKVNEKLVKYLHIENTGTVAITYQWRKVIPTPKILPLSSRNDASFFFNKNKASIVPGQKLEFPVWFHQRQGGIFAESWRLETAPTLSRAAFIIHMCGYAVFEDFDTRELEIDVYLDRCIRNTAVREIIDKTICNERPSGPPEPVYKSRYLEGKLFHAKNPSCFYHANLVTDLYRLYATASPSDASPWTLSLIDLRHVLLQNKNLHLRHETLKVFTDMCRQCLELCLLNPIRNTKYAMVYNVLCAFANKMGDESYFVKRNCIIWNEDSEMPTETPVRFVQERWPSNIFHICDIQSEDYISPTGKTISIVLKSLGPLIIHHLLYWMSSHRRVPWTLLLSPFIAKSSIYAFTDYLWMRLNKPVQLSTLLTT